MKWLKSIKRSDSNIFYVLLFALGLAGYTGYLLLNFSRFSVTYLSQLQWTVCDIDKQCEHYTYGDDLSVRSAFRKPGSVAVLSTTISGTNSNTFLYMHGFGPSGEVLINGRVVYDLVPLSTTFVPLARALHKDEVSHNIQINLTNTTGTQFGLFGSYSALGTAPGILILLLLGTLSSVWQLVLAILVLTASAFVTIQSFRSGAYHLVASILIIPIAIHLTGAFRTNAISPSAYGFVWSCVLIIKGYFLLTTAGVDIVSSFERRLALILTGLGVMAVFVPLIFGANSYAEMRYGFAAGGWAPVLLGGIFIYRSKKWGASNMQWLAIASYSILSAYDQLVFSKVISGPYFIHLEYFLLTLHIAKESGDAAVQDRRERESIKLLFREIAQPDGLNRGINIIAGLFESQTASILTIDEKQESSVLLAKTDAHPYLRDSSLGVVLPLSRSRLVSRAILDRLPHSAYTGTDGGYLIFPLIKGEEVIAVLCLRGFQSAAALRRARRGLTEIGASITLHLEKNYWFSRAEENAAARVLLGQMVHPSEEQAKSEFLKQNQKIGRVYGILYLDLVNFTSQTETYGERDAELALSVILEEVSNFCIQQKIFFTYRGGDTIIILIPEFINKSGVSEKPQSYLVNRLSNLESSLSMIRQVLREKGSRFFFDLKGAYVEASLPIRFNENWNPGFLVSGKINYADRLSRESHPGFIAFEEATIERDIFAKTRVMLKREITLAGFGHPTKIALVELRGFSIYSELGAVG